MRVIGWEILKRYDLAAAAMDDPGRPRDPQLEPWRRDLFRSAGMSALLCGEFEASATWFGRITEVTDPFDGTVRRDYFALIHRGISLWRAGRHDEANRDWEEAMASLPERHDAYVVRGHGRLLSGDAAGAAVDYNRILQISGQLGIVHVDIGDAWRYAGELDKARDLYRRGLAVDPADGFCRLRLGELALVQDNDPATALREAAIIRRMMPTLRVVDQLEAAARDWRAGQVLEHIPAARLEAGSARGWKVSPTKVYFEFFREDFHGWP